MLILNLFLKTTTKFSKNWIVASLLLVCVLFLSNFQLVSASKIDELESKKAENSKLINELQGDLEDLNKREDTLVKEIERWKREIEQAQRSGQKAEELKKQYEEEKDRLEGEIAILNNQSRQILLELQKNNLIGWVQIVVSSEDLGDALSKLYTFSSLQAEAEETQNQLEQKLVEKERSIKGQNEAIKQFENAEAYASGKQQAIDSLLLETQGDQAKYQKLVEEEKRKLAEIERKIAEAEAKARAELEAKRKAREAELERIKNEGGQNSRIDTIGQERLSFDSNFCWFEADEELKNAKGFFASPTTGVIQREFDNCQHDAVDISNAQGTKVKSAGDGVVITAIEGGYNGGYGSYILIKHNLGDNQTAYTLYAHLSKVVAKEGEKVSKGEQIGSMGSTGFATGSHLHFMIMSGKNYGGVGCRIGGAAKCFRPSQYIDF
jgi:murein DD-endopeptidase MepM/ murein hydrolase activator NlpD